MIEAGARLILAAVLLGWSAAGAVAAEVVQGDVTAFIETEPVDEDPDDPAIWVNPADPAASRIIGTDKDYGLVVFDLDGRIVQRLPDGRLNNVDIRGDVALGDRTVTLVTASRRDDNTIVFYSVGEDGSLTRTTPFAFPGSPQEIRQDIYGIGLYRNPETGQTSVIANFKTGDIVQWIVGENAGALELTFERQWNVPSQPEGVVADDGLGWLYIGEEDGGVWRFPADPASEPEGGKIDLVGSECLPADDVEGLGIYASGPDTGYLVVSAQGMNRFVLYPRAPDANGNQACLANFRIVTGATDPVGETDGLDVVSAAVGSRFPRGLMVVQDDRNEGFSRNFKYVSWADVEAALGLPTN
jgi:3-phytase